MSQAVKVGDRVRITTEGRLNRNDDRTVEVRAKDGFVSIHNWNEAPSAVTVERLDPEPRFRVGDRVRLSWTPGFEYRVLGRSADLDHRDAYFDWRLVNLAYGNRLNVHEDEIELVEPAPDQTFKLKWGDRIRNNKTGRVGAVAVGADSHLWVVDPSTYDEETGATAAAVEEYEEHYPGTYEIISRDGGPF